MFSLLRAEIFREAFLYFSAAFFQLVGVRGQKFQLLELGLVRRIGHLRMTGIKTFLVRQKLLRLFGKNKLGEEFGRIGMRRVFGDGTGDTTSGTPSLG